MDQRFERGRKPWAKVGAVGLFAAAVGVVAAVGARVSKNGRGLWYRRLAKPPFQPPAWIFAPVWTGLYGLMVGSAYRVWRHSASPARTRALALWTGQLALNGAWSPLFFGAHRPGWALIDIAALIPAATAYTATAAKVDRPAAVMMAPYLGWLGFAALLNEEIVRRNARA
jgi:translocator protein